MEQMETALSRLRDAITSMRHSPLWVQMVEPRDQVFAKFQPLFSAAHLPSLTEDEFKSFLYFHENHHWTGLHRQGNRICEDIPKLRSTLQLLLDDSKPIEERLDHVAGTIKGFGQATLTAVLHVVFPDKYGVCNNTSENGLSNLGIYPEFDRGEQFGSPYSKINSILVLLAKSLNVDLWTLDAVWWALLQDEAVPLDATADERRFAVVDPNASPVLAPHVFGLERHLHLFLVHNWKHLAPMNEWNIYSTNEKEDAGYEYICHVGKIDILARHKTAKKWLVIELKRNETSDEVVGQALRYMGRVKKHLAEPGDLVQGLIIAHKGDDPLQYAVSAVPNLEFQIYEVDFHLKPPPEVSK